MDDIQKFHTSKTDYSQNEAPSQWLRFASYAIDVFFMGVISQIVIHVTLLFFSPETAKYANLVVFTPKVAEPADYRQWSILSNLISLSLWVFLFLLPLKKYGQTFGKRLLKIRLLNDDKTNERPHIILLFFRQTLGYSITALSYLLIFGFFIYGSKKKFLHDRMFGTCVLKTKEKLPLMQLWIKGK